MIISTIKRTMFKIVLLLVYPIIRGLLATLYILSSKNSDTVNPLYNDSVCSKLSLMLKRICCYKESLTITRFQHNSNLVKENIVQMN